MSKKNISLVLLASGTSTRFKEDKLLIKVNDIPIIDFSLSAFKQFVGEIILVVNQNNYQYFQDNYPYVRVIIGGETREHSSYLGITASSKDYVLIHDASRPIISKKTIREMLVLLNEHDCVIPYNIMNDSVFDISKVRYLDRNNLYNIQTPQCFKRQLILDAFLNVTPIELNNYTDDLGVYLTKFNCDSVFFYKNEDLNTKLTYQSDLITIQNHLQKRVYKYGTSYDIHAFCEGRDLILGGIKTDYPYGLSGHSDADPISHCIANALLGACGKRDIGVYYPDSDPKTIGIKSSKILKNIYNSIVAKSYSIVNIDCMVILQEPKISKWIPEMICFYANLLKIRKDQISIKATTNENIGLIGNNEGIGCMCIVCIERDEYHVN